MGPGPFNTDTRLGGQAFYSLASALTLRSDRRLGPKGRVGVQQPLGLDEHNEPEPDRW
jgi:hypothetical protein